MKVRFYGTRGSIPSPMWHDSVRAKIKRALLQANGVDLSTEDAVDNFIDEKLPFQDKSTYGGDTSCVQIDPEDGSYVLCDAGTGLRRFGNHMLDLHGEEPQEYHILMSHLHWDHIMGFPFFSPAYMPGNKIHLHSCHDTAEQAFRNQHSWPGFPVPFDHLESEIIFHCHEPGVPFDVAGFSVNTIEQYHGGRSYGYRLDGYGKSVVYSTDSEHKKFAVTQDYPFVSFFKEADLLIFDAQYSLADAISIKEDWGHSSSIIGVELAQLAQVKRLCLFHHEPNFDDVMLTKLYDDTIRYENMDDEGYKSHKLQVLSSYDGLVLDV